MRADFINYEGDVIGLANSLQTFQRLLAQKINDNITTLSSQAEINNTLATKLKVEEWCYDNKLTETEIDGDGYYGAYTRIKTNKTPSLQCTGTKLTRFKDNSDMFTGALTADEIIFAGATFSPNLNYYLINSYVKENDIMEWYSLSIYKFYSYPDYDIYDGEDRVFKLDTDGSLSYDPVNNDRDAQSRPAVTLKAGTVITDGTGIIGDPYEIKMN